MRRKDLTLGALAGVRWGQTYTIQSNTQWKSKFGGMKLLMF